MILNFYSNGDEHCIDAFEAPLYFDITSKSNISVSNSKSEIIVNRSKVTIRRDWPGYTCIYYYISEGRIIVSDDIKHIPTEFVNLSVGRVGKFLSDRKHYTDETIYENINELPPGFEIVIDLSNPLDYVVKSHFTPISRTSDKSYSEIQTEYMDTLSEVLLKSASLDDDIVVAFSGGSDSLLLLQEIKRLGYKNVELVTFCVEGDVVQKEYANKSASYFDATVTAIEIDPKDAIHCWENYIKGVYQCMSELRLDGMPIYLLKFYEYVDSRYDNAKIIWGSQYSIISPTVSTNSLGLFNFLTFFTKYIPVLPDSMLEKILERYLVCKVGHCSDKVRTEYVNRFKCALDTGEISQIANLTLCDNYNSLKRWWMHHRDQTISFNEYNSRNVYPFHEQCYQERMLNYSLKERVGGWKNLLKLPGQYKTLFYDLLRKDIPKNSYSRGNYKTLDEFFTLFKNESTYQYFKEQFSKDEVKSLASKVGLVLPGTFEDYLQLDTLEVEKFTGLIFCVNNRDYHEIR
ncbi:hypothetical protein [Pseudoalteromonas ardens]|uniref:asparagine synthase (glutamine-hydrolyzing) n=1 Tax=Pseudoalteromonas rubra TaxID=43658 RepID=A0A0L0ET12_9GAMM|nr:hypothetical protein [Pseudoalteromonas sp. R96]KNC67554.1 hypothetical protein AC626_09980 [Pseudoalteromonas rubra]MDK1312573.1 hypothetical protein [Pseudoalteromonas sp. R96]